MRLSTHRLVRTLHLWIGAWGAVAAILFGLSGFMQNHRAILKLPQGHATETASTQLAVPPEAKVSAQALAAWLSSTQHLQLQPQQRSGSAPEGGRDGGRENARVARWVLSGGNARITYQAQFVPGEDSLTLRTSEQSALAVLSRLHKGVGGGIAWILLSDSFAFGLAALGVSGLILWSRGRSLRQMIFSAVGAVLLVLAVIGGSAVA